MNLMARKDDILISFLQHDIIKDKYQIENNELPKTVREALNSKEPIIKAIGLIVENLEAASPTTDNALRNLITQYLNEAAI
jgi:hypothetical protein